MWLKANKPPAQNGPGCSKGGKEGKILADRADGVAEEPFENGDQVPNQFGMHNAFRQRFLLKQGGEIVADVDLLVETVVQVPRYVPSTPVVVCGLTALWLPAPLL